MTSDQTTGDEAGGRAGASDAPAQPPAPAETHVPVPLPSAPAAPSRIPSPPNIAAGAVQKEAALKNDIANILKEAKLPERRDPAISTAHPATPSATPPPAPMPPAQARREAPPPAAPAAQPALEVPPVQQEEHSALASLHTMKGDLQTIVRRDKMSLVRIASLEARRRVKRESPAPLPPRGKKKAALVAASTLVLVVLGGSALYAVYYLQQKPAAPALPAASILFAEKQTGVPVGAETTGAFKQTIAGMLQSQAGGVGSITEIVPYVASESGAPQRSATLREFLLALGVHAPDQLLRALSGDFFFGVHAADVPSPLFVIPVLSYDNAFAGMLAWEPTIDADLAPIFKEVPALTPAPAGGLPQARQFTDLIMRNDDVRALKDDGGNIVLYYSFPTQNLLIIAASPYTFAEVLSRLQAEGKL